MVELAECVVEVALEPSGINVVLDVVARVDVLLDISRCGSLRGGK